MCSNNRKFLIFHDLREFFKTIFCRTRPIERLLIALLYFLPLLVLIRTFLGAF
uniref:Uncharacterized protein n=1 Tax=Lepeophtheirus salmonis TaxID=72036 RepID=A0A0K2VES8_LEPSM